MEAFWKLKLRLYGEDAKVIDETEAICRAETAEEAVKQVSCMVNRGWVVVGVNEGSHAKLLGSMAATGKQVSTKRWELYSLELAKARRSGVLKDDAGKEDRRGSVGESPAGKTIQERKSPRKSRYDIKVHLNEKTESDLIERAGAEDSMSAFVKRLIREEIGREASGGSYSYALWPWFSSSYRRKDSTRGRRPGAKSKCYLVRGYAAAHPEASHDEIAEALGVSRSTVGRWLKQGWRNG